MKEESSGGLEDDPPIRLPIRQFPFTILSFLLAPPSSSATIVTGLLLLPLALARPATSPSFSSLEWRIWILSKRGSKWLSLSFAFSVFFFSKRYKLQKIVRFSQSGRDEGDCCLKKW